MTESHADLTRNNPSKLPPAHKLTLVGGPVNLGSGACGPHYVYADKLDGTALSTTEANALVMFGTATRVATTLSCLHGHWSGLPRGPHVRRG